MQSTCFVMKIKHDKKNNYLDVHKKGNTWPEVLNNTKNANINKMKIYMLEDYSICFMEAENIKEAFELPGEQPTQRKWN